MKRVALLTSYGGQLFNPENEIVGAPGCYGVEMAVYETFRRLGTDYDITIFISKPKGYEKKRWNVTWKSFQDWNEYSETMTSEDIIVALRYTNIFLDYYIPPAPKLMFYAHDPYLLPQWQGKHIGPNLMRNVEPLIDQWITVGHYQAVERLGPWGVDIKKTTVIKNGITLEDGFDALSQKRKPLSFVYCSCPTRGLWTLLEKWNTIKQRFPDATLTIYYKKTPETIEKF